ncbi:hypothetical protein G5S52_22490 [Grimontia sp. S25]|uniref:Immunity MXAN-0049 protein domain-containing protein n=1 Tax=Grimontia sedimenti TaxID=2711294 RepID=A0A6M1RJJ0_9GAMM|nr:DUF1629 domain-containing protein [Grimontia sedimenti]NGO00285.1 hypothetical protein [Grimontia sedimenti]
MPYKVWTQKTDSDSNCTAAELENAAKLSGVKVLSRKRLSAAWPEDVTINIIDEKPPCDTFKCGPLLIVNERVKQLLERFTNDVEFLSVGVKLRGEVYNGYYFANVVVSEDILDRDNSVYEEFDGEIEDISSLRLMEDDASSDVCFLDVDDYILLVREEVAEAIANENIGGVKFFAPEDWRPW